MRIVILDGYTVNPGDNPWTPLQALGACAVYDRTPAELVLERARDAEILLVNKVQLSVELLQQLPRLRYVCVLATGYNTVDVAAAAALGIPVSNIPAYSTPSVVQTTFALLLELTTRVGRHDSLVKAGEWVRSPDFAFWQGSLVELDGLTMGIVGYGAIGRGVARVAQAFGMQVIAHTPHPPADAAGVRFVALEELFASADVVSLHCPQTPATTGFVNAALLARMRPSAFLLNLARGGLVHEADLADALNRGVIAGAGLDVVAVEPMAADNPLLTATNVVFTPHLAWASLASRQRLLATAVGNVAAFIAGAPQNVVNAPQPR